MLVSPLPMCQPAPSSNSNLDLPQIAHLSTRKLQASYYVFTFICVRSSSHQISLPSLRFKQVRYPTRSLSGHPPTSTPVPCPLSPATSSSCLSTPLDPSSTLPSQFCGLFSIQQPHLIDSMHKAISGNVHKPQVFWRHDISHLILCELYSDAPRVTMGQDK